MSMNVTPLRIIIDDTDLAAFACGMPNKYTRLATLLRDIFPDAEYGSVGEAGFQRREAGLATSDSDRLWYLSLEPSANRISRVQQRLLRLKIAVLAHVLRLPLPAAVAFKIRWAGAYNLKVALDCLTNVQKSKFHAAFDIGTDIRINMAFKGWLRSRRRASMPASIADTSNIRRLDRNDLVIMTGMAKGSAAQPVLLCNKNRYGYKIVLVLLDFGPLEYPSITSVRDYDFARSNFAVLVRLADLVIVPSDHARRVVQWACADMRVPQPEISILRPPIGLSPGGPAVAIPHVRQIVTNGRRFAVTILAFKPRKDFYWLLAVWRHALGVLGVSLPHLVVVLSDGVDTEYFDPDFVDPSLADLVKIVEQPTDGELTWLYANTSFVVHPPSFGGLGTVPIEAAAFGKPCLCERSEAYDDISKTGHLVQLDRDLDAWATAMKALVLQPDTTAIAAVDSNDRLSMFADHMNALVTSVARGRPQ